MSTLLILHSSQPSVFLPPSCALRSTLKTLLRFEELTIANMWEVAAVIDQLEKKGILKKQDILDIFRVPRIVGTKSCLN
ncbi:MAG: hypothetical protein VST68_10165 [Nitrospirota bacterium]|nr:hypothetical protein [Nitrospirota bacterium]